MSEEAALARPYTHLLEGRDPEVVLRETPAKLADVLKLMTTEHIEYMPGPRRTTGPATQRPRRGRPGLPFANGI